MIQTPPAHHGKPKSKVGDFWTYIHLQPVALKMPLEGEPAAAEGMATAVEVAMASENRREDEMEITNACEQ